MKKVWEMDFEIKGRYKENSFRLVKSFNNAINEIRAVLRRRLMSHIQSKNRA